MGAQQTLLGFFDEMGDVMQKYSRNNVLPDMDVSIPPILENEACALMQHAAEGDENCPDGGDPFAQWGKWHRAANIVNAQLREKAIDELGHGLLVGDWSHRALMNLAKKEIGG